MSIFWLASINKPVLRLGYRGPVVKSKLANFVFRISMSLILLVALSMVIKDLLHGPSYYEGLCRIQQGFSVRGSSHSLQIPVGGVLQDVSITIDEINYLKGNS